MKIAVFESPTVPRCKLIHTEEDAKYTSFVRVTEWAIVEFQPRTHDVIVPEKVAAIDMEIKEARIRHHNELAPMERIKANLLAVTMDKSA